MKSFAFLLLVVALLFALSASAQTNCVSVRGVAQEHLLDFGNPEWEGGRPGDPWVGAVQLVLSNGEILVGKLSENDGEAGPSNGTGQDRNGSYFFDFGTDGSFVVRYDNSEFPNLRKFAPTATGNFRSQGKLDVSSGAGRFAKATGNIMTDGPFVAWNLDQLPPSGRFNNTITGTLCNVTAK